MSLKSVFLAFKNKLVGRRGGGNLDKIQKNSSLHYKDEIRRDWSFATNTLATSSASLGVNRVADLNICPEDQAIFIKS